MRRPLLLLLLLIAPLFAGAQEPSCADFLMQENPAKREAEPFSQGFLWKITKGSGNPSYLLGTFHSDTGSILAQSESLLILLEGMKSFASETSFAQPDAFLFGRLTLTTEPGLEKALGSPFFSSAVSVLQEYGIDVSTAAHLKPWAAFLQMAQPPSKFQSLDARLYQKAAEIGLPILPLQNAVEMAESAESISRANQIRIAKETICNRPLVLSQIENLELLYTAGQVEEFLAEADRLASPQQGLSDTLFAKLVTERNKIFLPRLAPLLDTGAAFIAVGASHLYGKTGLLQSLKQAGFQIEPVDRAAMADNLLAFANANVGAPLKELRTWIRAQGLELPASALEPEIEFVPTAKLEKIACGGPCKVSFFSQGPKIYASLEIYHQLKQRSPGIMAELLSQLIRRIQVATLLDAGDRSCASWNAKNIQNLLLQARYLTGKGLPTGNLRPLNLPSDCTP